MLNSRIGGDWVVMVYPIIYEVGGSRVKQAQCRCTGA